MMTKKRENTIQQIEKRINKILKELGEISKIAINPRYEWEEEDVVQPLSLVKDQVDLVRKQFEFRAYEAPVYRSDLLKEIKEEEDSLGELSSNDDEVDNF